MTERAEPRNPKQKPPVSKPETELTESDLDKVSGGKTPTPSGPIPIPYPNTGSQG